MDWGLVIMVSTNSQNGSWIEFCTNFSPGIMMTITTLKEHFEKHEQYDWLMLKKQGNRISHKINNFPNLGLYSLLFSSLLTNELQVE